MPRLPLAPPPLPEEAPSSWVGRVAARYGLTAERLVRHLLPNAPDPAGMVRQLDWGSVPELEAALAEATGQPAGTFAAQRMPGLATLPQAHWPRAHLAWCQICTAEDFGHHGEASRRREWGLGFYLICSRHRCLLVEDCPRCFLRAEYRPTGGRQRLWCPSCRTCSETALKPSEVPFWPHGTPQQRRCCVPVSLSGNAVPVLLRVQADLLAALAGEGAGGKKEPWARWLRRPRLFEVLRRLSYVMLGPLWEVRHRCVPRTAQDASPSAFSTWTPGVLPPHVAAPALLLAATLLAAENGTALCGVGWNPELMLSGEEQEVRADTLLWHLDATSARLMLDLFRSPLTYPLLPLLSALRADREGWGAKREAARRQRGLLGARRMAAHARERRARQERDERLGFVAPDLPDCALAERERQQRALFPPDGSAPGYAEGRQWSEVERRANRARAEAGAAVYIAIGSGLMDGADPPTSSFKGTVLERPATRQWLFERRDTDTQPLIAMLAEEILRMWQEGLPPLRDDAECASFPLDDATQLR